MKLALLFTLCLLASAFDAVRPQDLDGGYEGGPIQDAGSEEISEGDGGSYEGGSYEEGPQDDGPEEDGPSSLEYDDEEPAKPEGDADAPEVKDKEAAGHGHYRRNHHHRRHHHHRRFHHHGGREIDRSTCSVQASYLLGHSRQRRFCRYATEEHDDCQACCEAASRRETRGTNKDDIVGFVTRNRRHGGGNYRGKREAGAAYAAAAASDDKGKDYKRDEPEWECVCCIPNHKHY
uniref:Uncharacterized protein n=1 Tax=Plectus sambesii TaxID=2011161 RepID=A0A914UY58_9BILA